MRGDGRAGKFDAAIFVFKSKFDVVREMDLDVQFVSPVNGKKMKFITNSYVKWSGGSGVSCNFHSGMFEA